MGYHAGLLALLLTATVLLPRPVQADLQRYVDEPDETYDFRVDREHDLGHARAYTIRLQSQTWQGMTWQHWLTLIVPHELTHPDKVVLIVGGGSNRDDPPAPDTLDANLVAWAANQLGVAVAVLQQVPNQPLLGGMYEDAAIAHTFARYLQAGGDWPLLMPMVKSVVRAMDTVEQVLAREHDLAIDGYVVSGASKRGWTTWLTAAVDPRIDAIAPMVIDVLNFAPQMRQQQATYGGASALIGDYAQRGLLAALATPAGQRLSRLVDPFAYRDELRLPKLILLGTNDPYWTVDAANLYLDQLQGPTSLVYDPNVGHGLSMHVAPTLLAFIDRALSGQAMPDLRFERQPADPGDAAPGGGAARVAVEVAWDEPAAAVTLWQAHSPDRDFRQAAWQAHAMEPEGARARAELEVPAEGWVAAFVQVRFAGDRPFVLSTPMTVLPQTFPHADP